MARSQHAESTVMKMTSKVTHSSTDIGRNAATDEDVNQEESRHKDDKYQSKSSSYKLKFRVNWFPLERNRRFSTDIRP